MGSLGSLSIVEDETQQELQQDVQPINECPTVIKVVGCGGGGSNAVNRMITHELSNVDFIVLNTDLQALAKSNAKHKLAIGQKVTKGLGAGGRPEVGEQSAEEDQDKIKDIIKDAHMVFITAGMGGGTGTGSAPVVARIAKELGCLTVAVVTTPFVFEGPVRMRQAQQGLEKLREQVDSLIVIPNEQLFKYIDKNLTVVESFRKADEVLCQGVFGISNIITHPGDVNTDFADVKNAMKGQGNAIFGIGIADGENRASDAAYNAINNPMLENSKIDGAKHLLVNIAASEQITLKEVGEIFEIVTASAAKDYELFWGQVTQPELEGKISVTVIATGFDNDENLKTSSVEESIPVTPIEESLPDDVIGRSELDTILNGGKVGLAANTGDFVSKKDLSKSDDKKEVETGALSKGLFDDDELDSDNSLNNRFAPPENWVDKGDDLTQPAIWKKSGFGRTINLDD